MSARVDTTDAGVSNATLQAALAALGQVTTGTKAELQARLFETYEAIDAAEAANLTEPVGQVLVRDLSPDTAQLLLDAATTLSLGVAVVRTTSEGFLVPREVADEAFSEGIPDQV